MRNGKRRLKRRIRLPPSPPHPVIDRARMALRLIGQAPSSLGFRLTMSVQKSDPVSSSFALDIQRVARYLKSRVLTRKRRIPEYGVYMLQPQTKLGSRSCKGACQIATSILGHHFSIHYVWCVAFRLFLDISGSHTIILQYSSPKNQYQNIHSSRLLSKTALRIDRTTA